MNILSATALPYADIVFFALIGLALILGLIRGLAKSFKGFFLSVTIVLVALLIIAPTFPMVRGIGVFNDLNNTITEKISTNEVMSTPIYLEELTNDDGSTYISYYVKQNIEGTEVNVPLQEALGGGIIGKLCGWLCKSFISQDGQTIGGVAGAFITDIVVSVIMFILYCIILSLVCWIIRKIVGRMHSSESQAVRVIDRILGAIISIGLMFIFILVLLAIFAKVNVPQLQEHLLNSKVLSALYLNNPITTLWTRIFG